MGAPLKTGVSVVTPKNILDLASEFNISRQEHTTFDRQVFGPIPEVPEGTDPEEATKTLLTYLKLLTDNLTRLQAALDKITENTRTAPSLNHNYFKDIIFVGGQSRVLGHGLGRAFTGWRINRIRLQVPGAACFAETQNDSTSSVNSGNLDKVQLTLTPQVYDAAGAASATTVMCDIEIW